MNFLWLVNLVLLAFPVGATLGVLLGLQAQRKATGQTPLFVEYGIAEDQYCQKSIGISPPSIGQKYTLNPNQWAWKDGDPGGLCMNVTSYKNGTYSTKSTAPEFSVTWQFPPGPNTQPVWAFPNIKVDTEVLPVVLDKLETVNLDLEWTYGVGDEPATSTDEVSLIQNLVNANVAIDMFLDSDPDRAQNIAEASHELMIWFGVFGTATQPIGLAQGPVLTTTVVGTTFSLYFGQNGLGQNISTWVAEKTTGKFDGDISLLVSGLTSVHNGLFPTSTDYLGYVGFGSETFSAKDNVTFHVPNLSLTIKTSDGSSS